MKKTRLHFIGALGAILMSSSSFAQTNVFDNIIATSPNHTYLEAAILQEGLQGALQNPSANLTVFAPTDAAFTALANALGTDIPGLLALPNLDDILLYHVLGTEVPSSAVTNGAIVQPLSTTNTLKLTVTSASEVFVNQAEVSAVDLTADNGVVHVLDAVVLPSTTVADVAIGSSAHTVLVAAVVEARLLPALTNPLASLTVFAPTDAAFTAALGALGLTANQLLASPDLADILLYHVLGAEVLSTDLSNGMLATPLNNANTLKVTIDGSNVYVNQAQVTTANILADNGAVHVLNAVVLPSITVADIALGSAAHTTLVTAVVQQRLLPVLTNPFAEFTVFAPTNTAFDNLATALGTDLNGILALSNLTDVLTYHVVAGTVESTDLVEGPVATVEGTNIFVSLDGGVVINDANVVLADLAADNGVVHVLDKVLLPSFASLEEAAENSFVVYPNPAEDVLYISGAEGTTYQIVDMNGRELISGTVVMNEQINLNTLNAGTYFIKVTTESGVQNFPIIKK
jgi:uncharacterized surface protein with fasciclin (FAS1) repeats